ncbi:MAG: HIT family protein [Terriglobia bacterium]
MHNQSCKFCEIVRGEVASHVVFQDDVSFVFLDHRPLFPGHCLVATREHYETLMDLPQALISPFFSTVQVVSRAMEEALGADGSFVAVNNRVSQSVPHLHVHIVPRRRKDGLKGFFWPRHAYEDEDVILQVQARLTSTIQIIRANKGLNH